MRPRRRTWQPTPATPPSFTPLDQVLLIGLMLTVAIGLSAVLFSSIVKALA